MFKWSIINFSLHRFGNFNYTTVLARGTISSFRKQLDCWAAPLSRWPAAKTAHERTLLKGGGGAPSTPILTTWPVACIIKYRVSRFKPHNYNSPPPSPSLGYCLARNFSVRDASGEMTRSTRQIQINRTRIAQRDERGEQLMKIKGILLFWWIRQRNRNYVTYFHRKWNIFDIFRYFILRILIFY